MPDALPYSQACENNKVPILQVLRRHLPGHSPTLDPNTDPNADPNADQGAGNRWWHGPARGFLCRAASGAALAVVRCARECG